MSCLIFLKLSIPPEPIFKWPALEEPGHWIKLSQLDATRAATEAPLKGVSTSDQTRARAAWTQTKQRAARERY